MLLRFSFKKVLELEGSGGLVGAARRRRSDASLVLSCKQLSAFRTEIVYFSCFTGVLSLKWFYGKISMGLGYRSGSCGSSGVGSAGKKSFSFLSIENK